jgi:hypothetical protein
MRKLVSIWLWIFLATGSIYGFDINSLALSFDPGGRLIISDINNYIPSDPNKNGEYLFSIYCSDGTFESFFFKASTSNNSVTSQNIYSGKSFLLEAQAIYDDTDDDPQRVSYQGAEPWASELVDLTLIGGEPNIRLVYPPNYLTTYTIAPRQKDNNTLCLIYKNPCFVEKDGFPNKFSLEINTSSGVQIEDYHNPFSKTNNFNFTSGSHNLSAEVNDLSISSYRVLFLNVKYLEDDQLQFIKINISNKDQGFCDTLNTSFNLMAKKDPHDPNKIISNVDEICLEKKPKFIPFTIVFQNIGEGEAENVIVELVPPNCFHRQKKNQIQIIEPKPDTDGTIWGSIANNNIKWYFNGSNKKLKNSDLEYKLAAKPTELIGNLNDTKDSVTFKLRLRGNYELPPCSIIPIQAKITFDTEVPIFTNVYEIKTSCFNCEDSCKIFDSVSQEITLKKGKSKIIRIGDLIESGYKYQWIPEYGLSNPLKAEPKFQLSESRTYRLIRSKACQREEFIFYINYIE